MGDENPEAGRGRAVSPLEQSDVLAFFRRPSVAAAAGALCGLGLGIILGRATVAGPSERRERPVASAEVPLSPTENENDSEPQPRRVDEYRVLLGRNPRRGEEIRGFERHRTGARTVARLVGTESSLEFDVEPAAGQYVLTAIVGLDRGTSGKLEATLDGKSVATWSLTSGWDLYSSTISRDLLAGRDHKLALLPQVSDGSEVNLDSVAVYPVSAEVRLGMGQEAMGHLIDGFTPIAGQTVWSYGPRSIIGVVLAPAEKPYRLNVRGAAIPALSPLSVRCKVNGTEVGSAEFKEKMVESAWSVPAKALRTGVNRIEFEYPRTAQPADFDANSKDKRPLALRFARLELVPQSD